MVARKLGQSLVQSHDVARKLDASRAERCAHEAEGSLALRCGHFLEADALAHVEVLVHPFAPFGIVYWKHGFGALLRSERREKSLCRIAHRRGGNSCGLDGKQVSGDLSIRSDALERLGKSRALGFFRH